MMWQEEADLLQTCTLPLTAITVPGAEGVLLWEIKFKKAVIPRYSWQIMKKPQSFSFNEEESMIQAVFRRGICHLNAGIRHVSVMYWISTRRTGNAGPSHHHHTDQKLPYREVPQLKSACWYFKWRNAENFSVPQLYSNDSCSQSKVMYSSLPTFLSPVWRTADTRRPIQYFSPFLNLNDWLRYTLFQGNPCWISHYSVCLRCLYNGNLGLGPFCIWASTTAVGSVGRCRTKRDWYLRV